MAKAKGFPVPAIPGGGSSWLRVEGRREQWEEGFAGLPLGTVVFCQPRAERVCDPKHEAPAQLCKGSAGPGWGHQPCCFCHPPCLSCLRLPTMVVWSALAPHHGPIVVTHLVASSSTFKKTGGEPEVQACHSASSELAINTLACPQGSKKSHRGQPRGWETLPGPVFHLPGCFTKTTPPALTLGLFNRCHFSGNQAKPATTAPWAGRIARAQQPQGLLLPASSSSQFALSRASLSQNFSEWLWELPPARPWDMCGAQGRVARVPGRCPGWLCRLLIPEQEVLEQSKPYF